MGAMQRRKGAAAELEVARLLNASGLYPEARRRSSGEESQEDRGRDLKGTPGICVQVQWAKNASPLRKFREAAAAAKCANGDRPAEIPIAFVRENGTEWVAVIRATDLLCFMASGRPVPPIGGEE